MGKVIKVNESQLKNVVKTSLVENVSKLGRKVARKVMKDIQPYTSHLYRDNDWSGVNELISAIKKSIEGYGELEVNVNKGGYAKPIWEYPNYKEYLLTINLTDGTSINGAINCHAAGTMEDLFSVYDMTCQFYI